MKIEQILFKKRNYAPIAFYIIGLSLAQPREDLFIFGMILVGVGELMRLWGISYVGADSTSLDAEQNSPVLVTNGAYAFIRKPVFTGNILMSIGMIIALGGWLPHLLFIGLFLFPVMYQVIAAYEENKLSSIFGAGYDEYRISVPRFYPRLSPYPERTNIKPDFAAALKNEKYMFMAGIIMLIIFVIKWNLFTNG